MTFANFLMLFDISQGEYSTLTVSSHGFASSSAAASPENYTETPIRRKGHGLQRSRQTHRLIGLEGIQRGHRIP